MKRNRLLWTIVLIVSVIMLIGYSIWITEVIKTGSNSFGYYGARMMNGWFNGYVQRIEGKDKLSVNQITENVNRYLQNNYGSNMKISDIFLYKDSDYYVSVVESDTGKGAIELLVNPYTGYIYPEYGPNMMWNEKYGMHGNGRFGMMGMMRSIYKGSYYNRNDTKDISRNQALEIADNYVKKTFGNDYSVPGEVHEFYGYYTIHINKGNKPAGMLSVNYHTGDIWYHTWHGQLEKVISFDEKKGE
ncbi:PepSY domain-containing protein [Caldicellulosiruptoraceae bacterium PP1]